MCIRDSYRLRPDPVLRVEGAARANRKSLGREVARCDDEGETRRDAARQGGVGSLGANASVGTTEPGDELEGVRRRTRHTRSGLQALEDRRHGALNERAVAVARIEEFQVAGEEIELFASLFGRREPDDAAREYSGTGEQDHRECQLADDEQAALS